MVAFLLLACDGGKKSDEVCNQESDPNHHAPCSDFGEYICDVCELTLVCDSERWIVSDWPCYCVVDGEIDTGDPDCEKGE